MPIDDPDLASELATDRESRLGPVAREAVARAGALVKAVTARITLGRFMRRHEVGARL
jgi:hypothetical protein